MKRLKEISISILVLIAGLIVIELGLRVINSDMKNYDIEMWRYAKELKKKDSILGHIHKRNKTAKLQNVEIKLNSLGMRSEEPNPDKKNILFIGSSISLGWGVDKDSSYAGLLNKNLKEGNLDFEVLNASIGNYNTYRYVEHFFRNKDEFDPDILVVNYFINDVEMLPMGSSNWILMHSQLAASLSTALKKLSSNRNESLVEYYNRKYDPTEVGYQLMHSSLKKLSEYASKNDIKVYFNIIPDIHFLKDYPFESVHHQISGLAQDLDFRVIDLLEPLRGIPFEELQIIPGDSHPNAYGHRLMAKELSNTIISDLR